MLSNFQLGNRALLQSFLVGQPELRVLLTSKAMEPFRQRVIASFHLGQMERAETRAYVDTRLRKIRGTGPPKATASPWVPGQSTGMSSQQRSMFSDNRWSGHPHSTQIVVHYLRRGGPAPMPTIYAQPRQKFPIRMELLSRTRISFLRKAAKSN